MSSTKKLPILLIKRGSNVENSNDVKTTTSILRTEQKVKSARRNNGSSKTNKRT